MPGPHTHRLGRRPWAAAAAVLTAAHHGFELASGVGLVLQPELGLGPALALWGTQLPAWAVLAGRADRRWDKVLAALSGAALGGALVHGLLWPWRPNRWGIPVLTEAEGLRPSSLSAYTALLYAWGAASTMSIVREVGRDDRRWALLGLASLPVLHRSARHHFSWLTAQAAVDPRWWNRAVAAGRS